MPVTTKEDKGKAVLAVYKAAKAFYLSFIPNKTERFSFKSGCVVRVENDKMHHQL